jgi:hypothetical protein
MNAGSPLWALFEIPAPILFALRVAAGIGAGLIGWFGTGPLFRILFRMAFHRPTPRWLVGWARLGGAVGLGLLVYYFLPIGGGPGWGWGTGGGGGSGGKSGDNGGQVETDKTKDKTGKDVTKPGKQAREVVDVELIGGARYKGEERYYLLENKEPAKSREELRNHFEKNKERIIVRIVTTPDSPGAGTGVLEELRTLANEFGIPTVGPMDEGPAPKK